MKQVMLLLELFSGVVLTPELLVSGIPTAGDQKNLIQFSPTTFVASTGEQIQAEAGWLTVPERHSKPTGSVIRLPVIRFKSTVLNVGPPIIYLAGGPGESGIETAKTNIFPALMALRGYADVLVFDQRGTGKAEPSLMISENVDIALDESLDSPSARKRLAEQAKEVAVEIQERGIDLSAYNTFENADDVNDLRQALGVGKITIWGHSYGSHLGLAILKRYGEHVDRAILGGVNGPNQRWRYPNDLEKLLEKVDDRIRTIPKLSREMPSVKQAAQALLAKLYKDPVTVQVQSRSVLIGKKEIQVLTALLSGSTEFIQALPLFLGQMNQGNYTRAAELIRSMLKERRVGTVMRFAMHIASGVSPERRAKIDSQKSKALFGNAINFPFDDNEFVSAWGVSDMGSDFRSPVKTNVPTLFLSGDLDGRTSIADAEEVRNGFKNSQHVIIEGAAHDFYHLSDKVVYAMLDFLKGDSVVSRIVLPWQFRGPNERQVILEIRTVILNEGIEMGIKQLRTLYAPEAADYLSSFVPGTIGVGLNREDRRSKDAVEIFKTGVELFPDDPFLRERLGELYAAAGKKELALEQYNKCLQLNSLNRGVALKVRQLTGSD